MVYQSMRAPRSPLMAVVDDAQDVFDAAVEVLVFLVWWIMRHHNCLSEVLAAVVDHPLLLRPRCRGALG